jgi:hypothetical protein
LVDVLELNKQKKGFRKLPCTKNKGNNILRANHMAKSSYGFSQIIPSRKRSERHTSEKKRDGDSVERGSVERGTNKHHYESTNYSIEKTLNYSSSPFVSHKNSLQVVRP